MQSTDLKIGVISANFNLSGNIPFIMQELNMSVSIGAYLDSNHVSGAIISG